MVDKVTLGHPAMKQVNFIDFAVFKNKPFSCVCLKKIIAVKTRINFMGDNTTQMECSKKFQINKNNICFMSEKWI